MPSQALIECLDATSEVDLLIATIPRSLGDPIKTRTARVLSRSSVVLLSSHFERYVRRANEQAVASLVASGVVSDRYPIAMRLAHSKLPIDEISGTQWPNRADGLTRLMSSEAALWTAGSVVSQMEHGRLLTWMKTPRPNEVKRCFQQWGIDDIFSATTRSAHTRTSMWGTLDTLVVLRNNIAHGDASADAARSDLRRYLTCVKSFCERADRRLSTAVSRLTRQPRPW